MILRESPERDETEAAQRVRQRLHQDLVFEPAEHSSEFQIRHLKEARGLTVNEFGPKSVDELKNEQERLKKWSAKFAGADRILRDEVENLRADLAKAHESDPSKSGKYVARESYDMLAKQHDLLRQEFARMTKEHSNVEDTLRNLKYANTLADEEKHVAARKASNAAEDVNKLRGQLEDMRRLAMEKQGAVNDLSDRLVEIQKRYDILGHHVLQLGEEKTSLLEALRERQSQLDFSLAQLQLMGKDTKMLALLEKRIKELEIENEMLRKALADALAKLADTEKKLKDCYEERDHTRRRSDLTPIQMPDLRRDSGIPKVQTMSPKVQTMSPNVQTMSPNVQTMSPSRPSTFVSTKPVIPPVISHVTKPVEKDTGKKGAEKPKPVIEKTSLAMKTETTKYVPKEAAPEIRHRGMVLHIRWHPKSSKHTYGARFLLIDSTKDLLGWAKKGDGEAEIALKFSDVLMVGFGYRSGFAEYKRTFANPHGTKTPESSSGDERSLTAPPVGRKKGLLVDAPRILLTTCFSLITAKTSHDFFTGTESETYEWMMRFSKVFGPLGIKGVSDRGELVAASGWTRLVEACYERQLSRRRLLMEGMEKAAVFAASTGLGEPRIRKGSKANAVSKPVIQTPKKFSTFGGFQGMPTTQSQQRSKPRSRMAPSDIPSKTGGSGFGSNSGSAAGSGANGVGTKSNAASRVSDTESISKSSVKASNMTSSVPQSSGPASSSVPQSSGPASSSVPQSSGPASSSVPQSSTPGGTSVAGSSTPGGTSIGGVSAPSAAPMSSPPATPTGQSSVAGSSDISVASETPGSSTADIADRESEPKGALKTPAGPPPSKSSSLFSKVAKAVKAKVNGN